MPVIQISKITNRIGLVDALPTQLDEGELALGIDTGQVFIGNPTNVLASNRLNSNQFPFANTELLTEWSDNIESLLKYSYRYRNDDQTIDSATPLNSDGGRYFRALQERLDEIVSVKSYGALGDGRADYGDFPGGSYTSEEVNNETSAIRRAAIDVSSTLDDPSQLGHFKKRALYFPAGIYVINKPLLLPPGSTWIGDGLENTVIVMADPTQDCVVETCDGNISVTDLIGATDAIIQSQIDQHTGNNMDPNKLPVDIEIQGITFKHLGNKDVLRLLKSSSVSVIHSAFESSYITGSKTVFMGSNNYNANSDSISVVIDPLTNGGLMECADINFYNCRFKNSTYALLITGDARNVTVDGSHFTMLYRGVSLGETPIVVGNMSTPGFGAPNYPANMYGGPRAVRVLSSFFERIEREGFSVWTAQPSIDTGLVVNAGGFNASIANRYEYVGDGLDSSGNSLLAQLAPNVRFVPGSIYNISTNDTFSRNNPETDTFSYGDFRVAYSTTDTNKVDNPQDSSNTNSVLPNYPTVARTMLANQASLVDFSSPIAYDIANVDSIIVDLSYVRYNSGNPRKVGTMYITTDGTNVNHTFNGTNLDPLTSDSITIAPVLVGSFIHLMYSNTSADTGTAHFNIRTWKNN